MATKTEINQMFLEDLYKIYATAEVKMLEKVAKRVKKGITTEGWNEAKLKNVQQLREEMDKIMSDVNNITKFALEKEIKKAYNKGIKGASMDLGMPTTIMKDMIPFHLQRLILQTHNIVDNTSVQILRNTEDVYREVIAETTTGVLSGVDTRMQASQDALNRFAAKGITGFVDKAGRNWELASYVEMATRTTAAHAALQGHIDRCLELDHDLIIVSSHAATCPVCAPWGGKPLSISGKTPGYATMATARAAGLFHPNCKHTVTAYFPFIDEPEGHEHDKGYNPELYEATQQQRHNERQIRKWKRLEAVALTDVERKKAQNKIRYWQYVQRQHVEEYNLKRKYAREGIKSRIGDATKASKKPELPKQTQQIHYKDLEKDYDAITNFENKFDNIINNLSDKEKDAIMMYTQTGGAQQINDYLRSNGSTPIFDEYKEAIDYIDSAIEKSKIPDNIIVHRSVGYNFLGDELKNELFTMKENFDVKKLIGMEFEDKGFVSTSLNKTFSNSINIDIKVKKGTNGIAIEKLSVASNEHEILFGRNSKLKIIDASLEKATGKINLITELEDTTKITTKPKAKKKLTEPKPKAPEAAIKSISIFDADGIKMELTYDEVMKMSTGEKKFIIKQKGININKDINSLDKNELDAIMNKMFNIDDPKLQIIDKIENIDKGYKKFIFGDKDITLQEFNQNQISSNEFLDKYNKAINDVKTTKDFEKVYNDLKNDLDDLVQDNKAYIKAKNWLNEIEQKLGIKIEEPKKPKQPKVKPIDKVPNVDKVDYEPLNSSEIDKSIRDSKDWFGLSKNKDYRESFNKYTGSSYKWMNNYYRKGRVLDEDRKWFIDKIEEGFKKAPRAFDRDTQVYRATGYSYLRNAGIDDDIVKEVEMIKHKLEDSSQYGLALTDQKVKDMEELLRNRMIDKVVTEKSFTSTAYEYGAYGSDKVVQLIINAPAANSNAVQLAGISQFSSESEILFAPGMDNLIEDIYFEVKEGIYGKEARLKIKVRVLGHNTVK